MEEDVFYIEKVQQGESEYFAFLIKKYQNHVFNMINKAVQNYAVSEDLTQETFFKAFKSIKSFDPSRPLFPYLLQIASNSVKDYFKGEKRKNTIKEKFSGRDGRGFSDNEMDKAKEMYDLIYALPLNYREVLLLRYRDGKNVKEISVLMKISLGNVKVRLFRGRKMLFEMWKSRNG